MAKTKTDQTGIKQPKRGFASMDGAKHLAIASMGGHAVPNEKRSFSTNRENAVKAGRIGGHNVPDHLRSFSRNRDLASECGIKGAAACHAARRAKRLANMVA